MAISNTVTRVLVSIIAIPLIVLASYLGSYYFFIFTLAIALISYAEYSKMISANIANSNLWLGFLAIFLVVANQFYNLIDILPLIFIFVLVILIVELYRNKGSVVNNLGGTLLGIFYIGFFSSSLIGAQLIPEPEVFRCKARPRQTKRNG